MGAKEIMVHLAEAGSRGLDAFTAAGHAADLAALLQQAAWQGIRPDERTLADALHALVAAPATQAFAMDFCSHVLLSTDPAEQRDTLRRLAPRKAELPTVFPRAAQWRMKAAAMLPRFLHRYAMREARRAFLSVYGSMVLPTNIRQLGVRIHRYATDGLAVALNPLIPAVHGKKSAERYMQHLEAILQGQDAGGLVIQPWRLCPALSPYAPTASIRELAYKLHRLIGLSLSKGRIRPIIIESGLSPTSMLVAEALTYALRGQDLNRADVALELPAYLKNTPTILRGLAGWAVRRAETGAAPLKLLLVKGSHLEEEDECTYRHGNANPVYRTKAETDARFRQLVHAAICTPPQAIVPMVGTHSVFDIAFALEDWAGSGRSGMPEFCMHAGLADHTARLLHGLGARVTLCSGVTNSHVGTERHLLRLLHELRRPGNAVTATHALDTAAPAWQELREQFLATPATCPDPEFAPPSDRFTPTPRARILDRKRLSALLHAGEREFSRWQRKLADPDEGFEGSEELPCEHHSIFNRDRIDYRFNAMDAATLGRMVQAAMLEARKPAPPLEERREQMMELAVEMEKKESQLMGLLMRESGMTLEEAEKELLTAIDACRLYAGHPRLAGLEDDHQPAPGGVLAVLPGDTHPLADAIGGILAGWACGSAVIYRPPFHSCMLGTRITELLKRMGFEAPRFLTLICTDDLADSLVADSRVQAAIIAGDQPRTGELCAKTTGKPVLGGTRGNSSLYLSANCDWETAVRDIADHAFAHAGQGIEIPHIILVHAALYDDQAFRNALQDAVRSLTCGPGWVEGTRVGLVSTPLTEQQQLLLTTMDAEESWLVQPHWAGGGSLLWSPGVRTGVQPDGFFTNSAHNVPAIGLLRVADTTEAIRLQQQLARGLYAGIYSGNGEEIRRWCAEVDVCNRDINCITPPYPGILPYGDAQPATPMRGGYNFTAAICDWRQADFTRHGDTEPDLPFRPWEEMMPAPSPAQAELLLQAARSIAYWWQHEFSKEHVLKETALYRTVLEYRPLKLALRAEATTANLDLVTMLMAALAAGCQVRLSCTSLRAWMYGALSSHGVELVEESRRTFEQQIPRLAEEGFSLRFADAPPSTRSAAAAAGARLNTRPALPNGRLELLNCLAERITTRRGSAPPTLI